MKKIIFFVLFIFLFISKTSADLTENEKNLLHKKTNQILQKYDIVVLAKFNNNIQKNFVNKFAENTKNRELAQYFLEHFQKEFNNFIFQGQKLSIEDIKKLTKGVRILNSENEFIENGKTFVFSKSDEMYSLNTNSLVNFYLKNDIGEYYFYDGEKENFIDKKAIIKESSKGKNIDEIRKEMLEKINKIRTENNKKPLEISETLNKSAQNHAHDMFSNKFYSHVTPNGVTPADRIYTLGYTKNMVGENIARGQLNVDDVLKDWMLSENHKENILKGEFTEIGIGFDNYYWVQNFGGNL